MKKIILLAFIFAGTAASSQILTLKGTFSADGLGSSSTAFYGNAVAYVDSLGSNTTARLGDITHPFSTIDRALDSLPVRGGLVAIGPGTFASPNKTKLKSNVYFHGSGVPKVNWVISTPSEGADATTAPTNLYGGTILQGTFEVPYTINNITVENFGVDVGSAWCTASNGGTAAEGLIFPQHYGTGLSAADGTHELQSTSTPRTNVRVQHIAVLCKDATSAVHAFDCEDVYYPYVHDVTTYFGTHGQVFKSIGGTFSDLRAFGHSSDGLILKANDYAYSYLSTVSNVTVGVINGAGGGIILDGSAPAGLYFSKLANFTINNTAFGILTQGTMDGVTIENGTIFSVTGVGFESTSGMSFCNIRNLDIRSSGSGGFILTNSAGTSDYNTISGIKCISNSTVGFSLAATTRMDVSDIFTLYGPITYGTNVYTMGVSANGETVTGTSTAR